MSKNLKSASKREYIKPMIYIEELEKFDVLTNSDNAKVEAQTFGTGSGPKDLFSSIFQDVTGS